LGKTQFIMDISNQVRVEIYQNLGKLFYAIAATDKTVQPSEFNMLKSIVEEEWLAVDQFDDDFNSDAAFQIEIVFDWLNSEENYNSEECFNDFISFRKAHKNLFTEKTDQLIMKTATKIASSFSGVNKSELILLAKLELELNKDI